MVRTGGEMSFVEGLYRSGSDWLRSWLPEPVATILSDEKIDHQYIERQRVKKAQEKNQFLQSLKQPQGHAAERIAEGVKEHQEWLKENGYQ